MRHRGMAPREVLRRRRWYRFFRALTILILLVSALGFGTVVGLFSAVTDALPRGKALADLRPAVPTRVLANDGSLLMRVFNPDQNRELVPLSRMGLMQETTVAIEDIRFWRHPGIDLRGIARAMVKNVMAGNSKEGASTITQQLARGIYLSREKKLTRKLQEIVLALELERRYSKQEILEAYLNQVYYGPNEYGLQSWGAEMAAQNFFGKSADKLTLAEAALLAGLPKNPMGYNPHRHPEAAKERRNLVLRTMYNEALITWTEYEKATNTPITLAKSKPLPRVADSHAPYFVDYILRVEMPRLYGPRDARTMIWEYGVDIHTSLDPRMQKVAEDAVMQKVEENRSRRIDDGALIAIDPQTGLVKAMVGGTNFEKDQYNIVTQGRRQPGSSFKPFVYTTALLRGYTPTTTVGDVRTSYPSGTGPWAPRNSDGRYMGHMPLQRALWLSRNAAAVNIAADIGIDNVIKVAHAMGIKSDLVPVLPTAIGATAVSPLEICSGYAVLANHGISYAPRGITRITTSDGNEVLYEHTPRPKRVIPAETADTMKDVMRGVIERGTARRARLPFPASGKTGTTNSYRDAWFIGYTDDLVAAVWVGNRQNQPMNRTFGGTVPAPIWREFMLVAHPIMATEHKERNAELARINTVPDLTARDMGMTLSPRMAKLMGNRVERADGVDDHTTPRREGDEFTVTVCQDSSRRATAWCPNTVLRTFVKGRAPSPPEGTCQIHTGPGDVPYADDEPGNGRDGVLISVCVETGKIATDKCPIIRLRRFTNNAPTETCPMHGSE